MMLTELTVRKIIKPNQVVYIIPERSQLKEWRCDDLNTFLLCEPLSSSKFFPPGLTEWTSTPLQRAQSTPIGIAELLSGLKR